jgi:hypothetical protein
MFDGAGVAAQADFGHAEIKRSGRNALNARNIDV